MPPTVAHPAELTRLDLYSVWADAAELADPVDPFQFDQRMAIYRSLIDATNHDALFGPDNRHNPLWGLMFQLQWQFRTDRLGNRTRVSRRIDPDAAWGYGNYALSVIPWLGAAAAGTVPALRCGGPPSPSRFDYAEGGGSAPLHVPPEFEPGVREWEAYFRLVAASGSGEDEAIRFALWKAHKTCLDAVAPRIAAVAPEPYSWLEHAFLRGWCRMVDYLWVAAWPTDFDFMTEHGSNVLPEQLLGGNRRTDLPAETRRNVGAVLMLAELPGWRYRLNLALWKRIMRTRAARANVVPMLDAMFNPNPRNIAARLRMLGYLVRG